MAADFDKGKQNLQCFKDYWSMRKVAPFILYSRIYMHQHAGLLKTIRLFIKIEAHSSKTLEIIKSSKIIQISRIAFYSI